MDALSWQGWFTIGVLICSVTVCAMSKIAPDMIFWGALLVLMIFGVIKPGEAMSGFSNSGIITVGVLYIVVAGLQQTGGLAWISRRVLGTPGSIRGAILRLITPVTTLSAVLNNTPVVAMLIPVVQDWARRLRISPSKLLMPLSYAALFGGICTLIGTSTNLVVNGLLISELHHPGLKLFEIAPVGIPCAIVGIIYLLVVVPRFLPERKPVISEADDPRQYIVEMNVQPGSPLIGKSIENAGLRQLPGLFLVEIDRQGQILPAVGPKDILQENDRLIFAGVVDSIVDLQKFRGLSPATNQTFKLDAPRSERCLVEVVVSNTCPITGKTIREGKFRTVYNAAVLAVARNGERVKGKIGDITLKAGDGLLLEAHPSFLERQKFSRDFYLISGVPDSEPLRHSRAPLALVILLGMIVMATVTGGDMLLSALVAAALMIVTGCCSMDRARRSVEWQVLLTLVAALGIGHALDRTGAAKTMADYLIDLAGHSPMLALTVVYGVTMVFTEFMTNNAAAALVFPIAVATAGNLGVSCMPFVVTIMMAASASFATPIGYQTNLMVFNPGGYKFTDFMRIGIPLNIIMWIMTVWLAPKIFPF